MVFGFCKETMFFSNPGISNIKPEPANLLDAVGEVCIWKYEMLSLQEILPFSLKSGLWGLFHSWTIFNSVDDIHGVLRAWHFDQDMSLCWLFIFRLQAN